MTGALNVQKGVYDVKDRNTNNIALLCLLLCSAFGACASEPLRGPEAWLELMGGNVRKDGCIYKCHGCLGFSHSI